MKVTVTLLGLEYLFPDTSGSCLKRGQSLLQASASVVKLVSSD